MGLIKSGIQMGTLAYIANKGIKAYGEHNQNRGQGQQQQYYGGSGQRDAMSPGQFVQIREANGYMHQTWCNGACGMHCNDGQSSQQQSRQPMRAIDNTMANEDYYGSYDYSQQPQPPTYERSVSGEASTPARKEKSGR